MADCFDLNAEIKKVEAELRAVEKAERALEAGKAKRTKAGKEPPQTFRTFSMVDGTKMRLNPMEFWQEVERLNQGMGEDAIRELVQSNFDSKVKPRGSAGLNINYSQMEFNEENVNSLLELMGERRKNSATGQDLMMPFTKEVAGQQMMAEIGMAGGNVEELARNQTKLYKSVDKLPLNMVMSKLLRQDATRHLADMLDDGAELLDQIGLSSARKADIARVAQYANFFEQVDALLARRVGQALSARKFSLDSMESFIESNPLQYGDVYKLTADTIEEGSLAGQILEAITAGDSDALRRLARVKRVSALRDTPINKPNFMTSVQLLNDSRKANLFSSSATWLQRNVVSGALVNATYMMEDVHAGAFRVGLRDGFLASKYAVGQTYAGMSTAFNNAFAMLGDGRAVYTREGAIEGVQAGSLKTRREDAYTRLNDSWDSVFSAENFAGKPVDIMRLFNDGARVTTGYIVEKLTDGRSTAGYSPVFSLLAAGDEVNRKMAFDWKTGHEAYVRAVEQWNSATELSGISKAEWVNNRAELITDGAVFSGLMTDDQLATMRRRLGTAQSGDMSNETLRLKMFNDLNGVPNPTSDMGKLGIERGMDVTFTRPLKDNVTGGIQRARQNPIAGWVLPVWQTPANSFKWFFDRDIFIALPKQVALEAKYGILGGEAAAKRLAQADNFSPAEMAQARAKTLVAMQIALATNALWQMGMFTDGGSFNDENNKIDASQIPPYSFSIGVTGSMQLSKLTLPGRTIDLVDLMGLQADVQRAFTEGVIGEGDFNVFMQGIVRSYTRVGEEKNTLSGVVDLLKVLTGTAPENRTWQETIGNQMSGVMPYSGIIGAAFRSFDDPDKAMSGRRAFTPDEEQLFGENPDINLFTQFGDLLARNLPTRRPTVERDWMGRKRQRPFGLPIDCTQPFAPCIVSDTPLDRWLSKHRLGGMPNADMRLGSSELGSGYYGTMTEPQYNSYRVGMYEYVGDIPAEAVLGRRNSMIPTGFATYSIDSYVQGNTLVEALTKLSKDPDYNADLDLPNSPSLSKNLDRSLDERSLSSRKGGSGNKGQDPRGVLRVYNAIINYYSYGGAQTMMREHPEFVERATATGSGQVQLDAIVEDLEATPLGLSPQ